MRAELDAQVRTLVTSSAQDRVVDYVRRGRQHERLSDAQVRDGWKSAFELMAKDIDAPEARQAEDDFRCELDLRGISPPYDEVRAALGVILKVTKETIDQLKADPDDGVVSIAN